ncbi:hypothetical protein [Acidiferrobacter sp.]|uniref:hypothetical protein n=1 Tax=Acidiferrobacter sp. TaxID=1872107 RepID=UPI002634BAF8|nr:hypothetical protein [Acidiferrobacter sp.]
MRRRAGVLAVVAVLLAIGLVWAAHRGPVVVPVIPRAPGHCVLPIGQMRRTHMMLLRAVRQEIVRHDARDTRFRISGCVACHAQDTPSGRPIPVNAPGQFCAVCHAYVGVHIDCFACHAAVPPSRRLVARLAGQGVEQVEFRIPQALRAQFAGGAVSGGGQ